MTPWVRRRGRHGKRELGGGKEKREGGDVGGGSFIVAWEKEKRGRGGKGNSRAGKGNHNKMHRVMSKGGKPGGGGGVTSLKKRNTDLKEEGGPTNKRGLGVRHRISN